LTNRDVRFADNPLQPVSELMTKNLITVREGVNEDEARRLLHQHRLEKLIVVDDDFRCVGLVTVKDMEKATLYPAACKDAEGRLRVAAASTVGDQGYERALMLIDAGADCIVVDTAHGHAQAVLNQVARLKLASNKVALLAGNVATADGAKALIDAGAERSRWASAPAPSARHGSSPGSVCPTTIMDCAEAARAANVPVIADGGIKYSGDVIRRRCGRRLCDDQFAFAGTDESGRVYLYQGRSFKSYRGMGSVGAMARGSADRYFQQDITDQLKLVPEASRTGCPIAVGFGNPAPTGRRIARRRGHVNWTSRTSGARGLFAFHRRACASMCMM
jgi:IMP dehydrogenase